MNISLLASAGRPEPLYILLRRHGTMASKKVLSALVWSWDALAVFGGPAPCQGTNRPSSDQGARRWVVAIAMRFRRLDNPVVPGLWQCPRRRTYWRLTVPSKCPRPAGSRSPTCQRQFGLLRPFCVTTGILKYRLGSGLPDLAFLSARSRMLKLLSPLIPTCTTKHAGCWLEWRRL